MSDKAYHEQVLEKNLEDNEEQAELFASSSSGTIIVGMKVQDAILLGFDTRSHTYYDNDGEKIIPTQKRPKHIRREISTSFSRSRQKEVQASVRKVKAGRHFAIAFAGNSGYARKLYNCLLSSVDYKLEMDDHRMSAKEMAAYLSEYMQYSDLQDCRLGCRMIIAAWEWDDEIAEFVPSLVGMQANIISSIDQKLVTYGLRAEVAEQELRENYKENMTMKDGFVAIIKAIQKAAASQEEDRGPKIGGNIQVCVFEPPTEPDGEGRATYKNLCRVDDDDDEDIDSEDLSP